MDLTLGAWRARIRPDGPDLSDAYALRARLFRGGADDRDRFDASGWHLTVEDARGLGAYARLWVQEGTAMARGYTGAFYDLSSMARTFPRALEVGRVAIDRPDPDLPRLLLALLARVVERERAEVLYGCASFAGTVPPAALARLRGREAPEWGPVAQGRDAVALGVGRGGETALPPLLRLYLALGAVVSDHAVIDRDLGTVHVLAAVQVAAMPPARIAALRGLLAPSRGAA